MNISENLISKIEKRLHLYANLNQNVLLTGRHGVGKTSIINSVFQQLGYKYIYLSGATIDPHIHLIGIPSLNKESGDKFFELYPPEFLAEDKIDAIFIDELNRADKKVINALMELIQFKSINGKKLNRLKLVWGGINPFDEDEDIYTVHKLDEAVRDRFQVQIEIPYMLNENYLKNKYGNYSSPFVDWWNELDEELKKEISPRRLDNIIELYKNNYKDNSFDIKDFLPNNANLNIKNLIKRISEFLSNDLDSDLINEIKKLDFDKAFHLISMENYNKVLNLIFDEKIDERYILSINEELLNKNLKSSKTKNPKLLPLLFKYEIIKVNSENVKKYYSELFKAFDNEMKDIDKSKQSVLKALSNGTYNYFYNRLLNNNSISFDDIMIYINLTDDGKVIYQNVANIFGQISSIQNKNPDTKLQLNMIKKEFQTRFDFLDFKNNMESLLFLVIYRKILIDF